MYNIPLIKNCTTGTGHGTDWPAYSFVALYVRGWMVCGFVHVLSGLPPPDYVNQHLQVLEGPTAINLTCNRGLKFSLVCGRVYLYAT
jgi:hypothetical protein